MPDKCKNCGEQYLNSLSAYYKWCKPCQINHLKTNFMHWTSGNEKLDVLVQEMQLKINSYSDKIFEWIPYNQFKEIKEIDKDGLTTMYLAIWKDGPLDYDYKEKKEYVRSSDEYVVLKYLCNSENVTDESLNEV